MASTGQIKIWNSGASQWEYVGAAGPQGATGVGATGPTGATGAPMYVGTSAPGSPTNGQLWWDTDDTTQVYPPGMPRVRGPLTVNYNTANITTGITLYTTTVGEVILDFHVVLDTVWNATARMDFGDTADAYGLGYNFWSTEDLTATADDTTYAGVSVGQGGSYAWANAVGVRPYRTSLVVNAAKTLKVWITQDGLIGGSASTSTTGSARIYLITVMPEAF